jgi:hypothetical protein
VTAAEGVVDGLTFVLLQLAIRPVKGGASLLTRLQYRHVCTPALMGVVAVKASGGGSYLFPQTTSIGAGGCHFCHGSTSMTRVGGGGHDHYHTCIMWLLFLPCNMLHGSLAHVLLRLAITASDGGRVSSHRPQYRHVCTPALMSVVTIRSVAGGLIPSHKPCSWVWGTVAWSQ